METVFTILGNIVYVILAGIALWGAYCVIMVWNRVAQKRFKDEEEQDLFLQAVEEPMLRGDFESASEICEGDGRAMCQISQLAIDNRKMGFGSVRKMVVDRFQRDVLSDLEHRLSWVNTVIKAAPMIGLLGTVMGMMAAFSKLSQEGKEIKPNELASDIMFALITTACGLAIAIPLVLSVASINIRIRKMEDLISAGLNKFLEAFKVATKS